VKKINSDCHNRRIYIHLINNAPVGSLMYGRGQAVCVNVQADDAVKTSTNVLGTDVLADYRRTDVLGTNVLGCQCVSAKLDEHESVSIAEYERVSET